MNLDRVAALLASGLKAAQVATIVGVGPSRISQLMADESFQLILAAKTILVEKEDIEEKSLTAKYIAAEHALINQVMNLSVGAELRDVTAALRVVGDRQERMKSRIAGPVSTPGSAVTVNISLPSHAFVVPNVTRTTQNEITAIDGNTIAPLNATAVTNLFKSLKKGDDHVQETSVRSPEVGLAIAEEEGSSRLVAHG